MLNMLKNKILAVAGAANTNEKEALWLIADAEGYAFVEDYLDDMLDYHDRMKLADWLNFKE